MTEPSTDSLFAQWLYRQSRGEAGDFEAFCAAHPEHADELRELHQKLTLVGDPSLFDQVFGAATESGRRETNTTSSWADQLDKIRRLGAPMDRYARGDEIGRGGMGSVHQVLDHLLERSLAMKVLDAGSDSTTSTGPATDDASLGRFLEEALVTARLDHPYIVPVHDLGLDARGRVYFAMKRVRGEDLRGVFDRIRAGIDGWTTTRGVQVILKVCEAMAYAHSKRVIHRDLKPGNVMVGPFGEVYVMDWGLARILDRPDTKDVRIRPAESTDLRSPRRERHAETPDTPLVTMDGDIVGTPSYMPLEQAEGNLDAIGPRTDVYAVGAMLYHLLAGHAPYVGAGEVVTPRVILTRVRSHAPQPLHELAPDAPAELVAIVEKAMAREAKDRYPDMAALAADLQAYLDVKVVSAYETGAIAELKKWVQRNPTLAAAAGLLVVVLAGATAIVSQQKREVEKQKAAVEAKNKEVEAKNVEVTQQKNFAEARKTEFDQLAGKVYLERALEREKELYPPWPEKIEAMQKWLAGDVKRLLDLKPTLESTLADMRGRALPLSDAERERDRTTHPRLSQLESLRPRLAWLRSRMAALAAASPPPLPTLPSDLETKTARELNDFAWPRVDPDVALRVYGEEPLALAAAQRAVAKIEAGDDTDEPYLALDTLAWACFANGLDAEANADSARALEAAPDDKKAEYTAYSERLEKAIAAYSGEAGARLLADLESQAAALDTTVNTRRTYTFALESETFLYTALSDLAASIASFESGAKAEVEQRLSWAKNIGELTLRHPNARVTWDEARAAILKADDLVASKLYAQSPGGPLDLKPQMGLVPIGMNPVTKLWEFYELRSACDVLAGQDPATLEIPVHLEDGSIEVKDGTGIVFVLLPGGTFLQGAQNADENAPNYDPRADPDESLNGKPVSVTLSPFFLAKHETTQGQWLRLSGTNPSYWMSQYPNSTGLDSPVEYITWEDCEGLCRKVGLLLPTEARWEYGCRAGTTTVFSFGNADEEMAEHGNVRDASFARVLSNTDPNSCDAFDDGEAVPCRVGRFAGNGFGLFDMHGNVWEWCQDGYGGYATDAGTGDGSRAASASSRVYHGGCYSVRAVLARSAVRVRGTPDFRYNALGARFARNLIAVGD